MLTLNEFLRHLRQLQHDAYSFYPDNDSMREGYQYALNDIKNLFDGIDPVTGGPLREPRKSD